MIDIETVPVSPDFETLTPRLQELWTKKWSWQENPPTDSAQHYAEKAGILAEFARIICISFAFFKSREGAYHLEIHSLAHARERDLLQAFFKVCDSFFTANDKQFCGHNIREFDIPFICRRALIHRVKLPTVLRDLQQRKPWENPMMDTLQFWKFGEYKHFTSVDLLAAVLDIPSPKADLCGADVSRVYWQEKDLPRIEAYCRQDVVTVAQILMRLNELPLLQPAQIHHQT